MTMYRIFSVLLLLAAPLLASAQAPMPPAPTIPAAADAPIRIEKAERSGYAILTLTTTGEKPITQSEWVVFSTAADITYDEAGPVLIVTIPADGQTVFVYVNAMIDGKMTKHISTTIQGKATAQPTPAIGLNGVSPPANQINPGMQIVGGPYRVSLILDRSRLTGTEQALATSQAVKQALAAGGSTYQSFWTDSATFQQKILPGAPGAANTPALVVVRPDGTLVRVQRLTLTQNQKANEALVLSLVGPSR